MGRSVSTFARSTIYGVWLFVSLIFAFAAVANAAPKSKKSTYRGPSIHFIFDVDGVLIPNDTEETFPVFLWEEATSSFNDLTHSKLPKVVEVPKQDWELGVKSDIPHYNLMPIKDLVGRYYDKGRAIHDPGNSYYDKPIKLSNGESLNPRMYYQDPVDTHQAFRTGEKEMPLVKTIESLIRKKKFGPAFDLAALSTRADLPVSTMLLSYRGHDAKEWEIFKKKMVEAKYFQDGATIDRIVALNNPKLAINDPTSGSQFGRSDTSLAKRKIIVLEYVIDHILTRRIDRESGESPRPNVLVYAEDNIEILQMVRDLFLQKVRGVRDRDNKMNVAQAPLKLILLNLAPEFYYEDVPAVLKDKPRALANKPIDLDALMVFESASRYRAGEPLIQRFSKENLPKDPLVKVVSLAFNVSESTARKALSGDLKNCPEALLGVRGENQ